MGRRSAAFERFMASTEIDYERWHDGIGYDLDAIGELHGHERAEAEAWLLTRADRDWRDLEGLLALGSDRARSAVVEQLGHGRLEQRLAAARRLASDPAQAPAVEAAIIDGLRRAEFGGGLSDAIDLAVERPSPAVVDALFEATRRPATAVHAAAALAYLHGHAAAPFDDDRRPFFLRFVGADPADRRAAFEELCRECGVDPGRYP